MKDDLISRQAAIDALAENMPSLTTPDGCGQFDHDIYVTDEAYVDCMQIIHELPSAQPGWIPCSERLPFVDEYGKSDQVLATCGLQGAEASSIRWLRILYFNGCNWCFPTGESYEQMVYAWMPLPTPYLEGGRNA